MIDCILKDSKGFMWFGTRNGLTVFDSTHSYHVFQTWDGTYAAISNCNLVIDQIESGYLPIEEKNPEVMAE